MHDAHDPLNSAQRLAIDRTLMASERTLMAWVRTSLSLISFGFSIAKFFQYLDQRLEAKKMLREHAPRVFGLALVLLGMGALIAAVLEHDQLIKRLHVAAPTAGRRLSPATLTAMILFGIGVLMLMNLAFRIL